MRDSIGKLKKVLRMVENNRPVERRNHERRATKFSWLIFLRSRVFELIAQSILSTILVGYLGWQGGIMEMRSDVSHLKALADSQAVIIEKLKADVIKVRIEGSQADATTITRIAVVEGQHEIMIRILERLDAAERRKDKEPKK